MKTAQKKRQASLRWKLLFQFFMLAPACLFFVFSFSFFASPVHAINKTINFQGKIVKKADGTNITDGTYSFTFKLYDAASNGNLLWQETQSSVSVTAGVFQVQLGSSTAFNSGGFNVDFNAPNLYLDITFNSETFSSRVQLTAVPNAMNAQTLDDVVATPSANGFDLQGGLSNQSTVHFNTSGTTLTINPSNAGALTVQSNGANTLTLDTGAAATITEGATATTINIGTSNTASTISLGSGTGGDTIQIGHGTVATGNSQTIQIGDSATGTGKDAITIGNNNAASSLSLLSGTGAISLGSSSSLGNIIVQPNAGNSAALIVNQQANIGLLNPTLFVASSAGVLKFSIDSAGNATSTGSLTLGGSATISNSSGALAINPSSGTLTSNATTINFGSAALTVSSCSGCGGGSSGSNFWTLSNVNGDLYPINTTLDLFAGGTATTSAKFSVLNMTGSGSPTASVSAGLSSTGGAYLTASGTLATTQMQGLTLGGSTTGPIQLSPNGQTGLYVNSSGNVGVGTTNPTFPLTISAASSTSNPEIDILTTNGVAGDTNFIRFNTRAFFGYDGVTSDALIQGIGGKGIEFNVNNNTLGSGNAMVINSSGNVGIGITSPTALLTVSGTASVSGILTVGNGTTNQIQSAYGPLQLNYKSGLNTWSQALTIQDTTGNVTLNAGGLTITTGGETVTAGNLAITAGALTLNGVTRISNAGVGTFASSTVIGTDTFSANAIADSGALSITSNTSNAITIDSGTTGNVNIGTGANGKSISIGNSTANTSISLTTGGTGNITLGSNNAAPNTGDIVIQPNAGGQAALIVNDQGLGDIFTASAGATTRFRITNTGGVVFQGDVLTSIGTGGTNSASGAVANAIGDQGSLVPNAGFESAVTNVGLADGWFVAATGSATNVVRIATDSAKGTASVFAKLNSNQMNAIYSTCIPIAGGITNQAYNLNYYTKGSSALNIAIAAWVDGYTSKSNCQNETGTVTRSVAHVGPPPSGASWTLQGTPGTGLGALAAGDTWAKIQFNFVCNVSCAGGTTAQVDGVRLIENSNTSGVDYAENYPANPSAIPQPGDVVATDDSATASLAQVIDADTAHNNIIGIVSTNPGQVLDDGNMPDPKVPIALAGRVPVKVSTANGPIAIGDYLTLSSIPGVAVKALTAGPTVAIAMQNYADSGIGTITAFVNRSYYAGPITTGLSGGNGIVPLIGKDGTSVNLTVTNGQLVIKADDGSNAITFDKQGNATFSGIITAKEIHADKISGIDVLTNEISALQNQIATESADASSSAVLGANTFATPSGQLTLDSLTVNGLATISADLRVKGNSLVEGILSVIDTIVANNILVNGSADLLGQTIFHSNVTFQTPPQLPSDSGGLVVVAKGTDHIVVIFSKAYPTTPVINATMLSVSPSVDLQQTIFNQGYSFVVTTVTPKGFTIQLNKLVDENMTFSWTALSVVTPEPTGSP